MSTQPEAQKLIDAWEHAITTRAHVPAANAMAEGLLRLESANAELQSEILEQARIIGMGAERELSAMSRIESLKAANKELLMAIDDFDKALSIDCIEHEDWPTDSQIALRNLRNVLTKHKGTS